MSLVPIEYPAFEENGVRFNVFPSQSPLPFVLARLDTAINTISSGTNGNVRITTFDDMVGVQVGDFVNWGSEGYTPRVSRVLIVNSLTDIEVDEIFVNSTVGDSFLNFKKDFFCEIRFVDPNTGFEEQNAITLFDFNIRAVNDISGIIRANIAVPSSFIRPNFDIQTGVNEGLSIGYRIQFRESFLGNRELPWESPAFFPLVPEDIPILLIHGARPVSGTEGFPEPVSIQKVYAGFPFITSFFRSNVNDTGSVVTNFNASYFDISKNLIVSQLLASVSDLNGVFVINESTENIPDNVVFARIEAETVDFNQQYDPSQYDPSQYA